MAFGILQATQVTNSSMKLSKPFIFTGASIVIFLFLCFSVIGSYNSLVSKDQAVNAAWAQVQTDYQRRSDLVPNLVATVKGAANFEQSTLTQVVAARSKATQVTIDPTNITPESLKQFDEAQSGLTGALSHLLAISESYPSLTATQNFRDLQVQLEGTENRIAVSRRDFNTAVQAYDVSISSFPNSLFAGLAGFKYKPYFQADAASQQLPSVNFQ
jgi:LemA protein